MRLPFHWTLSLLLLLGACRPARSSETGTQVNPQTPPKTAPAVHEEGIEQLTPWAWVNRTQNTVSARGRGRADHGGYSRAQREVLARRAAVVDAQRHLRTALESLPRPGGPALHTGELLSGASETRASYQDGLYTVELSAPLPDPP